MARIKPTYAMEYLGLCRDSFREWCVAVQLKAYQYEMSTRTYFLSGEFYAIADKYEIKRLQEIHGDKWSDYYDKYDEVKGFIVEEKKPKQKPVKAYEPKSKSVSNFINELKK